ncbi:2-succinyl-6-hydroxy-2,4-cyclohexadiene-1-carboxylate synthase [Ferrimonas marina]|uniref:Putative 2-succinyl-6-hydroxy-2,4-cyclohexadiene-1-carboxylate synthase n=1 Tax=Ferrimonas marina TaxID=299255 RepID=A0A1M5ZBC9_9GAMM|nr:2-succinyl-6-hydroxy-2,4-cyclohexadiene-1-carboxylate synthase [Ferrimonas marina]SHI21535.1 2-succinyl-6-hydroxy-2,4-cyclohexadiene-1-carboxylate synthase [Ferrimonas marina]
MPEPLAVTRWGQPECPPLVLLHGFLGSADDWQPVASQLGQHFHCHAIDLPGHGQSRDIQLGPPPAFDEVVQRLLARLSALPAFHLLGYSLGGRIALHLAQQLDQQAPQRLLSLTLESAHPGLTEAEQKQQRLTADQQWHDRLQQLPLHKFLEQWYRQGVFADLAPARRQAMIQARRGNDPQALSALYLGTSLGHQQDLRTLASTRPLTLLTGERDSKFTALGQAWAAQYPTLNHRVITGAGHNIHATAPQAFAQALLQR